MFLGLAWGAVPSSWPGESGPPGGGLVKDGGARSATATERAARRRFVASLTSLSTVA